MGRVLSELESVLSELAPTGPEGPAGGPRGPHRATLGTTQGYPKLDMASACRHAIDDLANSYSPLQISDNKLRSIYTSHDTSSYEVKFSFYEDVLSKYWHFPSDDRPLQVCMFRPLFFTHVRQRRGFLTVLNILCFLPLSLRTRLISPCFEAVGSSPMVDV
jgi:hypothetical protein